MQIASLDGFVSILLDGTWDSPVLILERKPLWRPWLPTSPPLSERPRVFRRCFSAYLLNTQLFNFLGNMGYMSVKD